MNAKTRNAFDSQIALLRGLEWARAAGFAAPSEITSFLNRSLQEAGLTITRRRAPRISPTALPRTIRQHLTEAEAQAHCSRTP